MSVLKVVEILCDSPNSWDEAARNGIARASKTVKNIRSAWVQDQSVTVKSGKIATYRVSLKVTFEVES